MLIKLCDRQARVENVSNQHRAIETLHHPTQHRGFAGADFASHDDQAFAAFNSVVKVGHHFGVRRREIDVARIRCQREWQLFQSVKFGIHISSMSGANWQFALREKLVKQVRQSQHKCERRYRDDRERNSSSQSEHSATGKGARFCHR